MGRQAAVDRGALADLVAKQRGVITRGQAQACALTGNALHHRVRDGGSWRILLPGIYLTNTGSPHHLAATRRGAVVRGTRKRDHRGGGAAPARYPCTADNARGCADPASASSPQPRLCPRAPYVKDARSAAQAGEVSYVAAARAVADAVRGLRDAGEIRAIVADGVQCGTVHVAQLADELARGQVQGSAGFRRVLEEVADGIRSSAEGDLRALVKRERLPDPLYNPRLYAGGHFIAQPDAWWPEAGVAAEIESRQWHLSPHDWERTLARDARMSACGIIVLHFPPRRLRTEPRVVAAEIRSALEAGCNRDRLPIRALPCA